MYLTKLVPSVCFRPSTFYRTPIRRLHINTRTISMSATRQHQVTAQQVVGFQRWVDHCNNGLAALQDPDAFVPLMFKGAPVGYFLPSFIEHINKFPLVFNLSPCKSKASLAPSLEAASPDQRTAAIAEVLATLRDQGVIAGWRNELYPVLTSFNDPPAFLIERAASPHFGIKAYGVHINGFVRLPESGAIELWVAKRSATKPTWPGKLDHIVAGGQPYGLSCAENVIKECKEEAGVPSELAATAKPIGAVSYISLQQAGLKRDVLFCYDLELPVDFVPAPQDGEVESFMRLPLSQVAQLVADTQEDHFKDNCNLVIIDFLIRHGCVQPDNVGYLELVRGLRAGDCS